MFNTTRTLLSQEVNPPTKHLWGNDNYALLEVYTPPDNTPIEQFAGIEEHVMCLMGDVAWGLTLGHLPTLAETYLNPASLGLPISPDVMMAMVQSGQHIQEVLEAEEYEFPWGVGLNEQMFLTNFAVLSTSSDKSQASEKLEGFIAQAGRGVFAQYLVKGDSVPAFELEAGVQVLVADSRLENFGPQAPSLN